VHLRLEKPGSSTVSLGQLFDVELYAQANGCASLNADPCAPADAAISSVETNVLWDPTVLELADRAVTGEWNPEKPCGCHYDPADPDACPGPDPCDIYCGDSGHHLYDWNGASFPDDCRCEGGPNEGLRCNTDFECDGGICADGVNAPCDTPGVNDFPANDGTAFVSAIGPLFGCDGEPVEPACATAAAPGLLVLNLKFRVIAPAPTGTTTIRLKDCELGRPSRVVSAVTPGLDLVGLLGNPLQINVSACDPPEVVIEGPRYLAVTPVSGPQDVAIRVTGVHPDVACMDGYAQFDGRVLEPGVGQDVTDLAQHQAPAAWGTVHLRGETLIGSQDPVDPFTFEVRADCDPGSPGTSLSDPVLVAMPRFADVGGTSGPDDVVDFVDITMVVDGFRNVWGTPVCCFDDEPCGVMGPLSFCNTTWPGCTNPQVTPGRCQSAYPNVDLKSGSSCMPDTVVDFIDIGAAVDSFRNVPEPCTLVCP
jgi:hypothetical protein